MSGPIPLSLFSTISTEWAARASARTKVGTTCFECSADLELVQPDGSRPDRIVGICPRCHAWTLIFRHDDGWVRLIEVIETVDLSRPAE